MKRFTLLLLLGCACAAEDAATVAADAIQTEPKTSVSKWRARDQGLRWLVQHQSQDGAWDAAWIGRGEQGDRPAVSPASDQVLRGTTQAMGALLAHGYSHFVPNRPQSAMAKAVRWLLAAQSFAGAWSDTVEIQAAATGCMAELVGQTGDPALRGALERGVQVLVSQLESVRTLVQARICAQALKMVRITVKTEDENPLSVVVEAAQERMRARWLPMVRQMAATRRSQGDSHSIDADDNQAVVDALHLAVAVGMAKDDPDMRMLRADMIARWGIERASADPVIGTAIFYALFFTALEADQSDWYDWGWTLRQGFEARQTHVGSLAGSWSAVVLPDHPERILATTCAAIELYGTRLCEHCAGRPPRDLRQVKSP